MDAFKKYSEYVKELSEADKASLTRYTEFCSRANALIHREKKLIGPDSWYYRQMLNIFSKGPKVDTAFTVYRGMDSDNCKDFSGFISTTYDKDEVSDFISHDIKCCIYKILIPPGNYTVLPLQNVSKYPEENEILLPPGRLVITGKEIDNYGYQYINCVYIHNSSKTFLIYDQPSVIFYTKEEWIERINKSVSKLLKATNKRLNPPDSTEDLETYETEFITMLSKLPYYNSIPEEVVNSLLYNYNEGVTNKFREMFTRHYQKYIDIINNKIQT